MTRDDIKKQFPDATEEQITALLNINGTDIETEKRKNEQLRSDFAALTESYQTLKQSKVLEVSGQDIDDTKQRINRLVREIDHCIDLLNV